MVNKLIFANVMHRPIRTIVSVLAVAIEVAMVILVVGLCHGMVNDSAKRVEGVGADILVRPPGSSFMMGMGEAPMPIKIGDRLAVLYDAPGGDSTSHMNRNIGLAWLNLPLTAPRAAVK